MANTSDLKEKGVKATGWNFLGMFVGQIRGFIVSLILARLLEPSDFGLISIALVFSGILDALVDMGFSSAIIQKDTVTDTQKSTVFWLNLLIGFIFSSVVCGISPLMENFFQMEGLCKIMMVLSWSFFISSFATLQTALMQKDMNFKTPFQARLCSGIISGLIGIVLAIIGCRVWSLVIMTLSGWLINSCIIWFNASWKPKYVFRLDEVRELWQYGWKMSLSTIISQTFKKIDTFVIGKLFSASSLGLYNRAQSLNNMVIQYSFSSIQTVMLPTLSQLQNDHSAMRKTVMKLIDLICFLNFFFAGLMYVCADDIIILLYGEKWSGSVEFFKILGVFSFAMALPPLLDAIMAATNRMTMYLNMEIIKKGLLLAAIPIGITGGLYPYVWSVQGASAIGTILTFYTATLCIELSFWKQLWTLIKYMLAFAITCLTVSYIPAFSEYHIIMIVIKGGLFFICFIVLNYIMKCDGLLLAKNQFLGIIHKIRHK